MKTIKVKVVFVVNTVSYGTNTVTRRVFYFIKKFKCRTCKLDFLCKNERKKVKWEQSKEPIKINKNDK